MKLFAINNNCRDLEYINEENIPVIEAIEDGNTPVTELNTLLTKLDVQNLLATHDQIAARFEEQKLELQKQNKKVMMEQHYQQQNETLEISVDLQNSKSEDIEEELNEDENELLISDEGKFLLSKAQHYSVENLKLVNIEKPDAPFGATIRNRDGNIVIGRIIAGGAAEQSGLLHEDDEILEINNIPVRGKTINDVCDMLVSIYWNQWLK